METPTLVPAINIALSGSVDGGFQPGHLAIAGESRHFKSNFAIKIASDIMKARPNSELVWFDNEFGTPEKYFQNFDIDFERVLHAPFESIESLRSQMSSILNSLEDGEEVIMIVDSLGGAASAKEISDAIDGSDKKDMTRQQTLKSLFRIITPLLKLKKVWMISINHVYMTMEMYAKEVMSSGKGALLSADNQWFIGRRQVKDGKDLAGFDFIIKSGKSRFIREFSTIPISVRFDGGIDKWSGLLDIALEGNFIDKKNRGSKGTCYHMIDQETGEVKEDVIYTKDDVAGDAFWEALFNSTKFKEFVEEKYKL